MAFDIATAKPMKFDLDSARGEDQEKKEKRGFWEEYKEYYKQPIKGIASDQFRGNKEMLSNFPGSLWSAVSGMASAVASPVDTMKAVDHTIKGAGVNILQSLPAALQSGRDDAWIAKNQDSEPYADAVGDYYGSRWGSVDGIRDTIQNDPAGSMLDVAGGLSLLGGGAQMAAGIPAKASPSASLLGNAADTLHTASAAVNPINATMNAGKVAAAQMVPQGLPGALYESAAKFGTTLGDTPADRKALVSRAMEEKIMPTAHGADKMAGLIQDAQTKILGLIDEAAASGNAVPRGVILKGIKQLKDSYRDTPNGKAAIDQIDDLSRQFLTQDMGKPMLTAGDLQKWKVSAYDQVNYAAKRNVDAPVKEKVLKATARAAKDEIEKLIPDADIRGMNSRQGELLELQAPIQRAANRIDNRNVISLDTMAKTGTGGMLGMAMDSMTPGLGTGVGLALGTGASILGNPKVKAATAISLHHLKKTGDIGQFVRNNPHLSRAEIAAYTSEVLNSASPQEIQSPIAPPLRR